MGMMTINRGTNAYYPQLGTGPFTIPDPVSKWWKQLVMVLDAKHRITSKNIVLSAASKDGRAQVDEKLTPEYKALSKDGAVGAFVYESTDHPREDQNWQCSSGLS
jgi:hypothetical protein